MLFGYKENGYIHEVHNDKLEELHVKHGDWHSTHFPYDKVRGYKHNVQLSAIILHSRQVD